MADGNLGNLWFSLGIRNDVSKELNKVLKGLQDAQGIITKIDRVKLKVDDEKLVKALNNAADYLRMLQQIEREQSKIDNLKKLNAGVDITGLETAEKMLKSFKSSLLELQSGKKYGGIDAHILTPYQKTLRNTLADVRSLTKAFEKDNSLSAASSNAARLSNELERVKNKLAEIRRLQSEGATLGIGTQPLLAGGNSLRGVERRINTMLGDSEMLANETKLKQLLSDIQLAFTKATGKIQEYNAAKSKAASASREQAAAETKAAQEAKRNAESVNTAKKAVHDMGVLLDKLKATSSKGIKILSDGERAKLVSAEQDILRIKNALAQISSNGGIHPVTGQNATGYMQSASTYSAIDSAKRTLADTNARIAETERATTREINSQTQAARELSSAFDKIHSSASHTSQIFSDMKSLLLQGGLVFGAQQFANSIIHTGGEIVQQHIALQSIINDKKKAGELFAQTQQLALQSPFKFGELNRDVKQLAAFGVETERLYDTTKRLADVASGLGISFERLGLAYGQVKARSWLDGKELRQFAYAGLPMLQKLADLYNDTKKGGRSNYTTSDIRKMITKREVSFSDVDQVFQRLTNEGGQFYNMQFVLSETLLGKWNKLIDAWDIMLSKFAEGNSVIGGTFMKAVDAATQLVLTLDKLSPMLLSLGTAFVGKSLLGRAATTLGFSGGAMVKELKLAEASQMKLYAATQMTKVQEGKISMEVAKRNVLKRKELLNSTACKDAAIMQSFAEGKINVSQLGALANKKQISAELIKQMRDLDLITAKEAKLLTLIRAEAGSRRAAGAQMQLGAGTLGKGALGSLGALLSGWNLAFMGVGAAMGIYGSYKQFSDEMKQKTDDMAESAKQHAESLKEVYDRVSDPKSKDSLADRVKTMKEVLYNSDLFTNSIQDQINRADTLNQKYTILKTKIKEAIDQQKNQEDVKDIVEQALKASKITPLAPQFMNKKQAGDFWNRITDESIINTIFGSSIDDRVKKYNEIAKALERAKAAGRDTAREHEKLSDVWDKMVNSNLARILQSIRISLKVNASAFNTWSDTVKKSFNSALLGVIGSLESADDIMKARLFAYAKIATMHPTWDLSDPKINGERGAHPVAIWMRYYLDNYVGKNKPSTDSFGGGSEGKKKKDTELERIRNRVELYKKFYSEYKDLSKELGTVQALNNLKASGDFKAVFGWGLKDVTAFAGSLDQLTASLKATTEERRKFLNNVGADKASQSRKDIKELLDLSVKELNTELDEMRIRYDLYKKVMKSTGDERLATNVALRGVGTKTPKELLRSQMAKLFKGSYETADAIFAMDGEDLKKYDKRVRTIRENWDKLSKEELKDAQNEILDIIAKHQTIEQKIEYENNLYDERKKKLELIKNTLDPDQYENAKNALDKEHTDALNKLRWDKFKRDNNWGKVFGDLNNLNLDTINKMIVAMEEYGKSADMGVEETKELYEALQKLTDQKIIIDPASVANTAFKDYSAARKARKKAEKDNGKDSEEAKKQREIEKKNFNIFAKAVAQFGQAVADFGSSFSSLGSAIGGSAGNILSGIGEIYSSIGSSMQQIKNLKIEGGGAYKAMGNISAVLTVATTMINLNKKLASILPNSETYYDHYAEKARKINKLREAVDNYRLSLLKARLAEQGFVGEDPLGNLDKAYKVHEEVALSYYNKLYEAQEQYIASSAGWKDTIVPILGVVGAVAAIAAGAFTGGAGLALIGGISSLTGLAATSAAVGAIGATIVAGAGYAIGQVVQSAIEGITYKDGQVDARSNMQVQTRHRTWLRSEKTQNLEEWVRENIGTELFDEYGLVNKEAAQAVLDSGITLVGETEETLKKLMALRDEYEEWEKELKDYISSAYGTLGDNMVDAIWDWLKGGKNALDSFRDYASDTFKKVAQDAIKAFLVSTSITPYEETLKRLYEDYSAEKGTLSEEDRNAKLALGVSYVAGQMAQNLEQNTPMAETLAEIWSKAFKTYGYDIANGSGGYTGSNLVTGNASLSENTGDLIASYVNAIRASDAHIEYLLVHRDDYYDTMPVIARSQLARLDNIAQNTLRSADAATEIRDMFNDVINNTKQLHVS